MHACRRMWYILKHDEEDACTPPCGPPALRRNERIRQGQRVSPSAAKGPCTLPVPAACPCRRCSSFTFPRFPSCSGSASATRSHVAVTADYWAAHGNLGSVFSWYAGDRRLPRRRPWTRGQRSPPGAGFPSASRRGRFGDVLELFIEIAPAVGIILVPTGFDWHLQGAVGPQVLALNPEPAPGLGFLEFPGQRVRPRRASRACRTCRTRYLHLGQLRHPSPPPFRLIVDRVSFCDPFLRHLMRYWSLGRGVRPERSLLHAGLRQVLRVPPVRRAGHTAPPHHSPSRQERDGGRLRDGRRAGLGASRNRPIGFPCILKPVDGYAWQDVFRSPTSPTLRRRCTKA